MVCPTITVHIYCHVAGHLPSRQPIVGPHVTLNEKAFDYGIAPSGCPPLCILTQIKRVYHVSVCL